MRPNIHKDFILSHVADTLRDAVSAIAGIGSGIETFPMCDYIMQSVFLKMTGFQEQKLKCICWELATVDFEYRYDYTTKPVGERSSYKDKQSIYKDLVDQIKKRSPKFKIPNALNKTRILKASFFEVKSIFDRTNLSIWSQKSFQEFESLWMQIEGKHFANNDTCLLTEMSEGKISLLKIYKNHLYIRRNRIAHNTQSYQQNLPTLKALLHESFKYENYFLWFATLILIDELFIELYQQYLLTFED